MPLAHAFAQSRSSDGAGRVVGVDRERQVLDLFRLIAAFRARYDASLLEQAAACAASMVGPALADDLMAVAIRIDNEMRCQTTIDYAPMPVGTADRHDVEDAFLGMVGAAVQRADRAALGLAGRLGVTETRALFASARLLGTLLNWPPRVASREAPARSALQPWKKAALAYGQA